jgi:hypothetical protein
MATTQTISTQGHFGPVTDRIAAIPTQGHFLGILVAGALAGVTLLSATVTQPTIEIAPQTFGSSEETAGTYFTVSTKTTITQPRITITEKSDIS